MRGYQKKVIFFKDKGSHLFDEAYFVISRRGEEANINQSDMVSEANRIIRESLLNREYSLRKRKRGGKNLPFVFFFLGAFTTILLGMITLFIFIKIGYIPSF